MYPEISSPYMLFIVVMQTAGIHPSIKQLSSFYNGYEYMLVLTQIAWDSIYNFSWR